MVSNLEVILRSAIHIQAKTLQQSLATLQNKITMIKEQKLRLHVTQTVSLLQ